MNTNVWIMNHYAGNQFFDRGGRHYNFAKYLKQAGYAPVVFCCSAKHTSKAETFFPMTALWEEKTAEELGVPFVFVQGRPYVGNGKQRVLNMIDFYRNVKKAARQYAAQHGKPDVIYASSVHPLTLVAGIQLAKHFGVKCICEVRDLWPESIVEYSARLTKHNPLIKLLYQGEKWIYRKADKLIFTVEGGRDYIIDQGWDTAHGGPVDLKKVYHINNGVDLETFAQNQEQNPFQDEDLRNTSVFKIVYTGSIRKANNLALILDVAKKVRNPAVKFLIWGDGDELPALCQRVKDEDIRNVVFKGRVEKKFIPAIIGQANLVVLNYEMHDIWKYGGSQNKLFEYLAGGTPVLTNLVMGYDLIERYQCGFHVNYSDLEQAAAVISEIAEIKQDDYLALCRNAQIAVQEYDFKNLTKKLIAVIEK